MSEILLDSSQGELEVLIFKVANLKLNDAISKPEIGELVEQIDKIILNQG